MSKIVFTLIFCFLALYSNENMEIRIKNISEIANFPSGSGVVKIEDKIYAIGDDSPYLWILDENFNQKEEITLIDIDKKELKENRINKKKKPDFEALEAVSKNELVVFASSSKPKQRDLFLQISLLDKPKVKSMAISSFYDFLRDTNPKINIEAVAFNEGILYLFDRENNILTKIFYDDFLNYNYLKTDQIPKISSVKVELPQIKGIKAWFLDATMLNFTTSAEKR